MTYSFTTPPAAGRTGDSPKSRVEVPRRRQSNVKPKPEPAPRTPRDKSIRPRGGYTPNSPQSRKAAAENFVDDLKKRETELTIRIDNLKKQIDATQSESVKLSLTAERNRLIAERTQVKKDISFWNTQKKQASAELSKDDKGGGGGGGASGTSGKETTPPQDTTAAVNLSATKELYFRGEQKFLMDTLDIKANSPGYNPELSPIANYQNAEALWKSGIATKGRIQTFVPFTGRTPESFGGRQLEQFAASKALSRRAFQFHYNPGSVDMTYGSVPDVDLGYLASGQSVTNFLQALGQVSFEILLNRMTDMKYITPSGDFRKPGIKYATDVYDREPLTDSNRTNELKDIYNKGTMYDLEFLLKVLMGGVSFKSQLRGGELTSDLGFAIPQPVELHLGNRLRYVISVTSLSVRHVIFNERMVPLFSTVSIMANRIPSDTVGVTNLDLSGGQAAVDSSGPPPAGAKGSFSNPVVPGGGILAGGRGIQ